MKTTSLDRFRKKCQNCYRVTARYIFECHCMICQSCLNKQQPFLLKDGKKYCKFCKKMIKFDFIDSKNQSSVKSLSILFGDVKSGLEKIKQSIKFQRKASLKYCHYLQTQLKKYKIAIAKIISVNPSLEQYFRKTINLPTKPVTQPKRPKYKETQDTLKPSYRKIQAQKSQLDLQNKYLNGHPIKNQNLKRYHSEQQFQQRQINVKRDIRKNQSGIPKIQVRQGYSKFQRKNQSGIPKIQIKQGYSKFQEHNLGRKPYYKKR